MSEHPNWMKIHRDILDYPYVNRDVVEFKLMQLCHKCGNQFGEHKWNPFDGWVCPE